MIMLNPIHWRKIAVFFFAACIPSSCINRWHSRRV